MTGRARHLEPARPSPALWRGNLAGYMERLLCGVRPGGQALAGPAAAGAGQVGVSSRRLICRERHTHVTGADYPLLGRASRRKAEAIGSRSQESEADEDAARSPGSGIAKGGRTSICLRLTH